LLNDFSSRSIQRLSGKFAFPQIALLEQNLQISHHALFSCENKTRCEMPAYSVVKEHLRPGPPNRPAPGGTFAPKWGNANKKPGVERRAKPSV